jgi:hypothetical protein
MNKNSFTVSLWSLTKSKNKFTSELIPVSTAQIVMYAVIIDSLLSVIAECCFLT